MMHPRMHQAGLSVCKAKQTNNPCLINSKNKENESILLKLRDLSAGFLVLAVGLGCALMAFIGEILIGKIVKGRSG